MTPALFEQWTSVGELWAATQRAARGKRHRPSVARTLLERETIVLSLQESLRSGTWQPGRATVHEIRDPKPRTIAAAPFHDRIVHQALCASIGPLLDRGLVSDTYACRIGLGTHAALRKARAWANAHSWFVHLDVRKYFASIDHEILLRQLSRHLLCPRTLGVCAAIVKSGALTVDGPRFHFPGDDLFTPASRAAGLPIGHLTSQHFANRYLSPVDHLAKDRLGIRAYLRYMDDLLLFDEDRDRLVRHATALEERCHRMRLRLHPWQVQPTRGGLGYLGFRIYPGHVRVKACSVKRATGRLRLKLDAARQDRALYPAFIDSVRATFAHWAHGDTYRLRTKFLRELGLSEEQPMIEQDSGEESTELANNSLVYERDKE